QPSLGVPLQLASSPLTAQLSAAAGAMLQAPHLPLTHIWVPAAQLPLRPAELQARGASPTMHSQPSLGTPLQLASSPLTAQLSAAAGRLLQAPHLPLTQLCAPLAQLPMAPALLQRRASSAAQAQPSLPVPLQLASSPAMSQPSIAAGLMLQALHLPPVQVS